MAKTMIELDSVLSRRISVIAILNGKKKKEFTAQLLELGLEPYESKTHKLRFK